MEQKPLKPMTPFDCLVTPDELYMMKLMLPYTPSVTQKFLAVFIKFQELRHTISYFHGFPSNSSQNLLRELIPYMSKEEKETMEQMESMMQMMDMMKSMQSVSDDPQDLFNMFGNMFGTDPETSSN